MKLLVRIIVIVIALTSISCASNRIYIKPISSQSRDKEVNLNFYAGSYGQSEKSGNGNGRRGSHSDQALETEGLVAWWSLKTDTGYKYYYVRSKNNELNLPTTSFWKEEKYYLFLSFGPIFLEEIALNAKQKETAKFYKASWKGDKSYHWGNNNELYYAFTKDSSYINLRETAREWQTINSIELTEFQYKYLDARCRDPWVHVRCFIDDKFPELTKEQYEYIKVRARENDSARLDGDINPPLPRRGNPWA
jgi:hypothetical protein